MHRVDSDANVANLFDEGDPGVPRAPTQVDAAWLNAVQEELCNAITNAGISLVKGTNTQLRSAMVNLLTAQTISGVKTFVDNLIAYDIDVLSTSAATAVLTTNSSTGKALHARNTGDGTAVLFESTSNTAPTVDIDNSGTGTCLHIEKDSGMALEIAGTNNGTLAYFITAGTGEAVSVVANNAGAVGVGINAIAGLGLQLTGNATKAPMNIVGQAGAPSSPATGDIYYDTGLGKLVVRTGAGWETITSVL